MFREHAAVVSGETDSIHREGRHERIGMLSLEPFVPSLPLLSARNGTEANLMVLAGN